MPDDVRCLHGHFHPGQFNLADTFLFTLLRHPVDNIVSIYFFWKMLPSQGQPLHDLFLARGMSILQMASLPLLQYLYSGTYFGSFDMGRFGLIGRHEDRAAALGKLSEVSGIRIDDDVRVNVTAASVERERMLADKAQMGQLHDLLAEDIRFYERWCG